MGLCRLKSRVKAEGPGWSKLSSNVWSSTGYLSDACMTYAAVFGHVHMYRDGSEDPAWVPTSKEVAVRLSDRCRQWKALSSK